MKEEIQKFFKGEMMDDEETLRKYSRDTSIFEVRPKLVVYPKDSLDLGNLVKWVNERRHSVSTDLQTRSVYEGASLTVRAAGSDMTGGPLSESIVADITKHMNRIDDPTGESCVVESGAFYRDFELKTLKMGLILSCFPASKKLCALGGMIGNNCAGEKSLRYGKMENFILETKVIFSDGNEYFVKPLSKEELEAKMAQGDFEGNLYREIWGLLENNKEEISEAKPRVSKNSAGYYLWNVVDPERSEGYFDLNKLLVGSQGTLGIVTEAKLRLMKQKTHHDMIALMFKSWDDLPEVVNAILPYEPESLETFDDKTLKLGLRFMPEIAKSAGESFLSFALRFMPEIWLGIKMIGLPKLVVLVEISEESEGEVKRKVKSIINAIKPFKVWHSIKEEDREEEKFWIMRRESFNLLRKHVRGKKTAPFIEDFCIRAEKIPEFLPRAKKILEEHGIEVNIAGHAGNGNFHIIPLMDLTQESERAKITVIADKFYDLVGQYKGTITGEHNDGIMRTPYLGKMYSQEVLALFKQTKNIFDPQNIFNPGKKVGGSIEYLESHIIKG